MNGNKDHFSLINCKSNIFKRIEPVRITLVDVAKADHIEMFSNCGGTEKLIKINQIRHLQTLVRQTAVNLPCPHLFQ